MTKHFDSHSSLHEKILDGVNILADNVGSTLGPRGRNVILADKSGASPIVTKDGVTVAKFIEFEDPIKNAAAQILKQAASQTNAYAGDGTTTSTVLARAILDEAQKYLVAGVSPTELKRGMDSAVKEINLKLKDMSDEVTSLEQVEYIATISANGDKSVGKLISMAVDNAGDDGAITIEDGKSMETTLDIVEGFRFDSGYLAGAFVTNERRRALVYEDSLLLVTDQKIDRVDEILPILELVAREGSPLVIVSEEVEGQALAALIMNTVRGTMKVAAVRAPRYGTERREILKDLCASVGATFISRESGVKLSEVKFEHFGKCKKIESLKNFTTILGGVGSIDAVEERIILLKEELKQSDDVKESERIQERISRLASGIAIIRVGAPTEVEAVEKKHRVEDALEAVNSAQEEGILPGGGVALIRAAAEVEVDVENDEQQLGVDIIKRAVEAPLRQMAKNAGESADLIVANIKNSEEGMGWDFASGQLVKMYEAGIIDPAKVTKTALLNAASVSSTLITTNHAIVQV